MPRLTKQIRKLQRKRSEVMIHIHLLDAAGHLHEHREHILERTDQTVQRVRELIPVEHVDVMIVENPSWTIPNVGLGGYSPTPHLVQIWLDPNVTDFEHNLERELAPTLAHELHHAIRWHNPGYGQTLLEAMVTEGLAQAFEIPFRDGQVPQYAILENPARMDELMELAQLEFQNTTYDHNGWFFGSKARDIPRWTGYALGFEIAKRYFEKADTTAGAAYAVTAKTVFETLEA
jgi:uncharacterized protein YjaZ